MRAFPTIALSSQMYVRDVGLFGALTVSKVQNNTGNPNFRIIRTPQNGNG